MQAAFLFGGCRGDGTRAAEDEAFVLDIAGGDGGRGGAGEGGVAEEAGDGQGVDGEDAQVFVFFYAPAETAVFFNHQF